MTENATQTPHPKRKMMALPPPTHKLVSRVAALRGQSISEALYTLFREELRRQEDDVAWALAPAPFSIRPTYTDNGCEVLLWHPSIPSLILNRKEAFDLAEAIHNAATGVSTSLKIRTESGRHNVRVIRNGRCILLNVDGENAPITYPAATDVGNALISASVHAGPIRAGGPI